MKTQTTHVTLLGSVPTLCRSRGGCVPQIDRWIVRIVTGGIAARTVHTRDRRRRRKATERIVSVAGYLALAGGAR